MNNGMIAGVAGLAAGLVAGVLIGAVLLADEGGTQAEAPAVTGNGSQTPTPSPATPVEPLPTETSGWDPCATPGLCAFLEMLDQNLGAEQLDAVMAMIEFDSLQCGTQETELFEGIYPIECRDWPYGEPILTAGYAPLNEAGYPVSHWALRDILDRFIAGPESDCNGKTDGYGMGVRAVVSPPDPTLYWTGEVSVLVGPPLDCFPVFQPDSGQRHVFNLRRTSGGEWQIESIVEFDYDGCEDAYYRYVGDIRYYPLNKGRPIIQGTPTCPEN